MPYHAITFGASGYTAGGTDVIPNNEQDAFHSYTVPSSSAVTVAPVALAGYPVAITSPNNGARAFTVDTSFEPYRREAFRHRSIPAQRQSIMMTNIAGQGTVSTEGLWRREQVEWSMGAGQLYLDRKTDSQETRFYQSKGIDVFSYPLQATLLPDTYRKDGLATPTSNLMMVSCGDYVAVANSNALVIYRLTSTGAWSGGSIATWPGGTAYTINSITSNDTVVYIATTNGIYYVTATTSSPALALYVANDTTTGYTGGYDMVRWANDQLIGSRKNRLYAFQVRSSTGFPSIGSIPFVSDTTSAITSIAVSGTTATITTSAAHNLAVNQPINLINTKTTATIATNGYAFTNGVATVTTTANHGLSVGENITMTGNSHFAAGSTYTSQVLSVTSNTVFTCTTTDSGTSSGSGNNGGTVVGDVIYGFNAAYYVASVPSTTTFTVTVPSTSAALGFAGSAVASSIPDVLYTHSNPNWIWSDATGGATQVYFAGYVKGVNSYSGAVYRSDYMGSSTTSISGVTTVTNSQVATPWNLNTPVQALPMSPDEYPTCIKSYLNYIFIGTNRGIRMAQTLSIYDPTATATGDLRAGPVIPNILQPVTQPVTGIVGDGRFVWFTWSNYDGISTGLGKLDLSNFIANDPLAPAYVSDIMVTGQGTINSLDWDTYNDCPLMAVAGLGVYAPYVQPITTSSNPYGASTSNTTYGGNVLVTKYVQSGTLVSGLFDYGIPDDKVPVYFDYGVLAPASSGVSAQAFVNIDPNDGDNAGVQAIPVYPSGNSNQSEYSIPQYKAEQFSVALSLNSNSSQTQTPVLHRWTLKAWPATVQGTQISVVLQLFSVNSVEGSEVYTDPYDNFVWLETLRQNQDIITYQEGPLIVQGVIDSLDWIPHKRRGDYVNGFEGDCVVYIKTVGPYTYTNPVTFISTQS